MCWNCRGVASKKFEIQMRNLLKRFKPKIVILLEPKISRETTDMVCKRSGKKRWARAEAISSSGGVWVLWNKEEVELKLRMA